jgi:hypothetical protein
VSKPDELLDDLGRLARTQEEQASAGEIDAGELLRRFDAEIYDRIAARVLPLVQPEPATEASRAQPSSSQRAPHRLRSRRWLLAVVPTLAAAAALLWLVRPRSDAPLPIYALELRGGTSAERGTPATAPIRVGPGDSVTAVLRPATTVSGPVAAWIFIDGRAVPDAPTRVVEQSAAGALRISGLGPVLAELAPGRHWLQLALGRPGSLPEAYAETLPSSGVVAEGVQLLTFEVERLPP